MDLGRFSVDPVWDPGVLQIFIYTRNYQSRCPSTSMYYNIMITDCYNWETVELKSPTFKLNKLIKEVIIWTLTFRDLLQNSNKIKYIFFSKQDLNLLLYDFFKALIFVTDTLSRADLHIDFFYIKIYIGR